MRSRQLMLTQERGCARLQMNRAGSDTATEVQKLSPVRQSVADVTQGAVMNPKQLLDDEAEAYRTSDPVVGLYHVYIIYPVIPRGVRCSSSRPQPSYHVALTPPGSITSQGCVLDGQIPDPLALRSRQHF